MTLELADIQGNVLQGYGLDHAAYVFIRIGDERSGRSLLRELAREVSTALPWPRGHKPPVTLNVALSANGLRALGVDAATLAQLPGELLQGMAARAERWLGDTGPSRPARWERGLRDGSVHVLVSLAANDLAVLEERERDLVRVIDRRPGLDTSMRQRAGRLALDEGYAREHFGFLDGFGQPAVEGQPLTPRPGEGVPTRDGGWRPLKPGEFILGLPDEHGGAPVPPVCRNGTFVVYRKLRQHVARFRRFVADFAADQYGGDEELVAAKIVGRWRDGTPLTMSPQRPEAALADDKLRANDFRFSADADGARCPLGAHIRRAHPRDGLAGGAQRTVRHRIVRRGMPYGPLLAPGFADDGIDRGLIFVCFNASVTRQFESVNRWLNDGDAFGLGATRDPLSGTDGERSGQMTLQGRPPVFLPSVAPFVTTRGGEYLLQPGLTALRKLGGAA